jgi:3-phenylpropionate/trans-cinnamate dioxygenase ferredoxin reductase subunit
MQAVWLRHARLPSSDSGCLAAIEFSMPSIRFHGTSVLRATTTGYNLEPYEFRQRIMKDHLVIVGAGQAAAQLIHSSRQLGYEDRITLIGEEPYLPYQRPPLSKKYLAGDFERSRLFLKPEAFYEERGVEVRSGRRGVELNTASQTIRLDDDSTLAYDRLALATGASPRKLDIPGNALDGVHYLRTITDVDAIRAGLEATQRVVIIGAGYIGLEVASSCTALGTQVTVLEAAPRILGRVVSDTTAQFFADLHASHNVSIHCDAAIERIDGSTRVKSVIMNDGTVHECDMVIIGIGVTPNTSLAESAGIECDNGISVDPHSRTNVPNIVALGDCTSHPHPLVGTRVRLESVQNAIEQGKSAASTLYAQPRAFDDVPWFWSDQYDVKLQIAGLARNYDSTVVRGDIAARAFAVYYLDGRRLVAVDAIAAPRDFILAKKLLAAGAQLDPEVIKDPNVDLEAAAKAS